MKSYPIRKKGNGGVFCVRNSTALARICPAFSDTVLATSPKDREQIQSKQRAHPLRPQRFKYGDTRDADSKLKLHSVPLALFMRTLSYPCTRATTPRSAPPVGRPGYPGPPPLTHTRYAPPPRRRRAARPGSAPECTARPRSSEQGALALLVLPAWAAAVA